MGTDWRDEVYQVYLSRHYAHLNRLDAMGYELAALTYARTWERLLPAERDILCLDIGCGAGQFLYYLRSRGFKNIVGVDRSVENVELAKQMGFTVIYRDAIEFLKEELGTTRRYGLISILDVIEHLTKEELWNLLNLIYQVLQDGGCVLVKTVNASSLIGLYGRYMDITHEMAFTEETLEQIFSSVGFSRFEIIQVCLSAKHSLKEKGRQLMKRGLYWILYRLLEGRPVPRCVDLDITAAAWK